jgi:hypothetical protein
MRQLLDSNLDLAVTAGFLYVPLPFDPSIEAELKMHPGLIASPGSGPEPPTTPVMVIAGRHYIKSMSLPSLVQNYETIHPQAYEQLRMACLQQYPQAPVWGEISSDRKLRPIIFQVLPHFVKIKKGIEKGQLSPGEVLDTIVPQLNIEPEYYQRAQEIFGLDSLRRILRDLETPRPPSGPPPEGLIPARELQAWLHRVLVGNIIDRETVRLKRMILEGEQSLTTHWQYLALQLYIADHGRLEVDGFGVCRLGSTGEYLIYKRTGEYALKDYYGRIYLFPDCRVAVATQGRLKPVVLEKYKHPFLYRHAPAQEICLRNFGPPATFTAANVIQALEEGINALYYGYNSRRRNGYHSLDRVTEYHRSIDFADYLIHRDHPKIISREIEVKNRYT